MRRRTRGFTLIEVMVALFILALTFIGVIGTASYVSRTIDVLQEKTLALWVAQNAVSEMTIGAWGEIHDGLFHESDATIAGRSFHWKSNVTSEEHYFRVNVSVAANKQSSPLAEVIYYAPH